MTDSLTSNQRCRRRIVAGKVTMTGATTEDAVLRMRAQVIDGILALLEIGE